MTTVLIVDDQPSIVEMVRFHIEGAGFEASSAGDADEGWRTLVSSYPDAAVIDLKLPGADGWSLIERIRTDGRFSGMPVVVLSGMSDQGVVDRAAELGCDFLSKPFASSALVRKLQDAIRHRGNGAGTPPPAPAAGAMEGRIQLVTTRVVLLLTGYRVEGNVHLPPELSRFSDAWESLIRDQRAFLPITDAKVTMLGESQSSFANFLEVRKSDIQGVFPRDAEES
ncbi:MAG: response regulator [Actinomycetota bacterium]